MLGIDGLAMTEPPDRITQARDSWKWRGDSRSAQISQMRARTAAGTHE